MCEAVMTYLEAHPVPDEAADTDTSEEDLAASGWLDTAPVHDLGAGDAGEAAGGDGPDTGHRPGEGAGSDS